MAFLSVKTSWSVILVPTPLQNFLLFGCLVHPQYEVFKIFNTFLFNMVLHYLLGVLSSVRPKDGRPGGEGRWGVRDRSKSRNCNNDILYYN